MSQSIDLGNTDVINFDGQGINILQLNGNVIWEQVGLDLNYTGLDVNGNVEGLLGFDGTIVAYGVGKPTITYYKEVTPTPTAEEGYYGYYFKNSYDVYVLIDIDSFDVLDIIIGTTPCYEPTDDILLADGYNSTYLPCNGYNSEYYGGYDFSTPIDASVSPYDDVKRKVPKVLKIPDTHNGLPVTTVLNNAFYGGTSSSSSVKEYYQSSFVNDIVFGENLIEVRDRSFSGIVYYGVLDGIETKTAFNIPNGLRIVKSAFYKIGYLNKLLDKIIIPESVTYYMHTLGDTDVHIIICRAIDIEFGIDSLAFQTSIVFKRSSKKISGQPFEGNIPSSIVFEHTDEDEIIIDIESSKSALSTNIYTNNTYVRSYDWASKNITPTFYSLSEYTGELE